MKQPILSFRPVLALFPAVLLFLLTGVGLHGQCVSGITQWPQNTIYPVAGAWQTASTTMYAGDYAKFSVTAGQTYEFSLCALDGGITGYDSELTLFNDAAPSLPLAYADEVCGSDARITWFATFTGLLRVQVNEYNCLSNQVFTTLRYRIIQSSNPPQNDNCAQATPLAIGSACNPVQGTTLGATPSGMSTGCQGQPDDDVWYKFTTLNSNDVSLFVTPSGTDFDAVVELFTGNTCASLISVHCMDNGAGGAEEGVNISQLSPGQTIWVRVYDYYSTAPANPNFTICAYQATQGVPGDECSSVLPITVPQTCSAPLSGSFSNFSPTSDIAIACDGGVKDAWYRFTIPTETFYMDIDPAGLSDPAFEYFSGTCGSLTSLGCVNNYAPGVTEQVLFYEGTVGATIYLRVYDAAGNTASNQNYSICLYQQRGSSAPVNDACQGAGVLVAGSTCAGIVGTLQNAGPSSPTSSCGGVNTDDVWYQVIAADTAVTIQISPNGLIDGVMEIFTGTCSSLVSRFCIDDTRIGEAETVSLGGLQAGQSVYVRYYDYQSASASDQTFSICAWWEAPQCSISTPVISAGGPTTVCDGPVVLSTSPQPGVEYRWYRNGTLISAATANNYQATQSGSYTLVVSKGLNCTASSNALLITINATPIAQISVQGSPVLCQGGSIQLTALEQAGASYQWRLNGQAIANAGNRIYNATETGAYSVTVSLNACTATSSAIQISTRQSPPAAIVPEGSTSMCPGSSVKLNGPSGSGFSYQWLRDGVVIAEATGQNYQASIAGSYTLRVDDGVCSAVSSPVVLSILTVPVPVLTAGSSSTICQGATVNLSTVHQAGNTYRWQRNGVDIQNVTSSSYLTGDAGNYTVWVTYTSTCSAVSNSVTVTVNPLPPAQVQAGGATTFCLGGSVLLQAPAGNGYIYQWRRNGIDLQGVVNRQIQVSETGQYSVKVSDQNGCFSESAALQVNVAGAQATISLNGPAAICDGHSVLLQANTGFGLAYEWYKDNVLIPGETQSSYQATLGGNYTVKITDPNTCSTLSPAQTITVGQNPEKPLIHADSRLEFCAGEQVELSTPLAQNYQYQWLINGQILDQATFRIYTANTQGLYSVRVQNAAGCQNTSESVEVIVNALPLVSLMIQPSELCEQAEPVVLNGGNPAGGIYSGNSVADGMFNPATAGIGMTQIIYTFENSKGCIASDTAGIQVDNCAGLNAGPEARVEVFPNPFLSHFLIRSKKQISEVKMLDMTGRIVYAKTLSDLQEEIFCHPTWFAGGVYLLQLTLPDGIQVFRLVKSSGQIP